MMRHRNWESLSLYAWHPYMHNPRLAFWLPRISVPTLVLWGASDRIVRPAYGEGICRTDPESAVRRDRAGGASAGDRAARRVRRSRHRFPGLTMPETDFMDAWWQCEIPYPFVDKTITDAADSVRASLPNRLCDPRIAATLFDEVLDEFLLCDDLGMNVIAIEHHAGINSLIGANPMVTGILARQTRKVRVLSLGTLVSLRPDPVRVAEEYATADVLVQGAVRHWLRQIGRDGDGVLQRQSGEQRGTLLGSDRSDPEGADHA